MTAVPPGLTVRDAQIAELIDGGASAERVIRIGLHRRSWTPSDVHRVVRVLAATGHGEHVRWMPPRFNGQPADVVLTPRQMAVVDGLCRGLTNAGIAAERHVTEDTVKTHLRAVYGRLDAADRAQVTAWVWSGRARVFVPNPNRRTA